MARPRLPTRLKVLKGSLNVTRAKAHKDEPILEHVTVGPPPDDLSPIQRAAWQELAPAIDHLGVTTAADLPAFRCLVEMRADIVEGRANGLQVAGMCKAYFVALGAFGMTPSDRSKVSSVRGAKVENPVDEFAGTG